MRRLRMELRAGFRSVCGAVALAGLAVPLSGCAEGTLIRTAPPGASVYVGGRFIGVSPVAYRVPEPQFSSHTAYRIEREGYEPLEGELRTYVAPGRIIGGIFGLGIPFAFRRVVAFHKVQDFQLQPEATASRDRPVVRHVEAAPEPVGRVEPTTDGAESKLRHLQDLYDRGLISEDEYRVTRSRIIRGL